MSAEFLEMSRQAIVFGGESSSATISDAVIFNIARQGFKQIFAVAPPGAPLIVDNAPYLFGVTIERLPVSASGDGGVMLSKLGARLEPAVLVADDRGADINLRRLGSALAAAPQAHGAIALHRRLEEETVTGISLRDGLARSALASSEVESRFVFSGAGLVRAAPFLTLNGSFSSAEQLFRRLCAEGPVVGVEFAEDKAIAQTGIRSRPALFLDRDGVLNHDAGYTHRVEDLRWIDGAVETILEANDIGALVIVVTNQAGVAYGYYEMADVVRFHEAMAAQLARVGAHIDAFYACPYHPDASVKAYRHPDPPDRKPNPGMILKALADWPIETTRSVLIGDRDSDVEAARRAGLEGILFSGGNLYATASEALRRMANPPDV